MMVTRQKSLAEMTVAEVLVKWPQTTWVFHRHNMACVGCAVAPFYTIADAADIYHLSLDQFLAELEEVVVTETDGPGSAG